MSTGSFLLQTPVTRQPGALGYFVGDRYTTNGIQRYGFVYVANIGVYLVLVVLLAVKAIVFHPAYVRYTGVHFIPPL
jgi:hypothetical protein